MRCIRRVVVSVNRRPIGRRPVPKTRIALPIGKRSRPRSVPEAANRWPGETIVVVAPGPSLTLADLDYCRGRARVLLVNAAARNWGWCPWADALYAADYKFWKYYRREFIGVFRGECWSVSVAARDQFSLHWVAHLPNGRLTNSATAVSGSNSGMQALHLAALFQGVTQPGFAGSRIILLGFDMQRTGGRSHCHGDHKSPLRNGSHFAAWIEAFDDFSLQLARANVNVKNATRETALTCFPLASLESALA